MAEPTQVAEVAEAPKGNPFADAPEAKKMITFIAICLAVFGSIFQSTTLSTFLPLAAADIGGMEIYSLASTVGSPLAVACMPLWGYIAARSPHMKINMITISMACGAIAVLLRAFAPSMGVIIAAMIFWGFVSPGIFVCGFALIREMWGAEKGGARLGLTSTILMIASLIGPIGGGALMDALGWRALNWFLLVFIGLAFIMLLFFSIKVKKEDVAHLARESKFDFSGTIALVIGLGGLIVWISCGKSLLPFGTLWSNVVLAVTIVALIVMVVIIKKKQGDAIIPAPAMKDRNVLAFTFANFFSMFSNMALFFFLPAYIINVMGGTGLMAGGAVAIQSIIGIFLGPIVGKKIGKSGSAKGFSMWNGALRCIFNVAFIVILLWFPNYIVVCVVMFLSGFYNSISNVVFAAGPQVMLKPELRMQGNSVIQCGQNFGGGVGTAVYTVCIAAGLTQGMPIALGIAAVAGALVFVCSLFMKKQEA